MPVDYAIYPDSYYSCYKRTLPSGASGARDLDSTTTMLTGRVLSVRTAACWEYWSKASIPPSAVVRCSFPHGFR